MTGIEKIITTNNSIKLSTDNEFSAVMHMGEKSLMEKLAEIVTKNGGDILEIGFGMHLSADAIQSNPNVRSHTIIEVHPEIYENALKWSENKPNVKIILGNWIDVLPINNMKYDGILHDTHKDSNIPKFLDYIEDNCKNGTIVGFFDYPVLDIRFDAIRHQIEESDYNELPYKQNSFFKHNQFELKYTTFDGKNFKSQIKPKTLI
jgi:hypothetical protein